MKRRAKLFLLLTSLLCLVGIGVVVCKIQQNGGVPFPGAVIVLDDKSWRSRYTRSENDAGYLWATTNTVLYTRNEAGKYRVIRGRIHLDGKISLPEALPVLIKSGQEIDSLSPDGKTLGLYTNTNSITSQYSLVRTDGTGRPIEIISTAGKFYWSPDNRYLYTVTTGSLESYVQCLDARTGAFVKNNITTKEPFGTLSVTPEGKWVLFTNGIHLKANSPFVTWTVGEVQDAKVVPITYQKNVNDDAPALYISPDGKRLLWDRTDQNISLWEKMQHTFLKKDIPHHPVTIWSVTDIDGKNERTIGVVPSTFMEKSQPVPQWTPDGKGVHFLQDGKLMYLAIP